jgi:hypothetical protein
MSDPTAERGGKPRRLFLVTPLGLRIAKDLRRVREKIWNTIEGVR